MIQAIGLTSASDRRVPSAVDDLTFEARPGQVTVLLGPEGAGKTAALRLALQIDAGRGTALFRGRPLARVPHPAREVGVLLGRTPGHPGRTARGHLRMLCAVAGVSVDRADELLEVVGLRHLAEFRLGSFSAGMDRRIGMAGALVGDPHTLVLDEPARGLSPRERGWMHGLLRGFAAQGGAVLVALREPEEAVRIADRVVTVRAGRLVADQDVGAFLRTRYRPRVAVSSPQAERLATLLPQAAHPAAPQPAGPLEVVHEGGQRLSVYGSSCADVGEIAHRHGILVHRLADERGLYGGEALESETEPGADGAPVRRSSPARAGIAPTGPRLRALARPGPAAPLRYELHRCLGLRSTWCLLGLALVAALATCLVLSRSGGAPPAIGGFVHTVAGWPTGRAFPLPPAAWAAALLGSLAFGQEFRFPALAPAGAPVPRRLGLLVAKLAVTAALALILCMATVALDATVLGLVHGAGALRPATGDYDWPLSVLVLPLSAVSCAWAGLLAAGVFRSATAGLAAVAAVPFVVAPALHHLDGPPRRGRRRPVRRPGRTAAARPASRAPGRLARRAASPHITGRNGADGVSGDSAVRLSPHRDARRDAVAQAGPPDGRHPACGQTPAESGAHRSQMTERLSLLSDKASIVRKPTITLSCAFHQSPQGRRRCDRQREA